MPNTTKKTIVATIVQKTGVRPVKAKRALETVLATIKRALADGRKVDLDRLGRLSVVDRPLKHRLNKNLKHVGPTIDRLHKKHPKTVRLTKRQDLSENPLPTIVHKRPEPEPVVKRSFAIALPAWRQRIR
jgi:nucleoid DNA-binding protein